MVDPMTSNGVTAALRQAAEAAGLLIRYRHRDRIPAMAAAMYSRRVLSLARFFNSAIEEASPRAAHSRSHRRGSSRRRPLHHSRMEHQRHLRPAPSARFAAHDALLPAAEQPAPLAQRCFVAVRALAIECVWCTGRVLPGPLERRIKRGASIFPLISAASIRHR